MIKTSTGLAAYLMVTGSAKAAFEGGLIKVYSADGSGNIPDTADAAVIGTLLWTISLGGDGTGLSFDAAAVGRSLVKPSGAAWQGPTTAGTAAYYRLVAAGDDGTLSTTAPRVQGSVGNSADSDMFMTSPVLVTDAAVDAKILAAYQLTLPES